MSSHVKLWRDRIGTTDYDTQIKEVRLQLADQLRIFDGQVEQKTQVFQDLIDFLRRRGEIEGEYARSLDKLCDRFSSRIRKKEPSHQSVINCWQVLLTQTRQESKDHSILSDSYSSTLPQQLSLCIEHVQRLAKRSREICTQLQDGLLKVTTELHTALKTYYQYYTEFLSADGKLKEAVKLEEKQKQSASKKIERQIEKRQSKVQEIQLKCTKARNDYLLNLAAANACMNKYYLQDLSTLMDCCDLGYHQSISKVLRFYLTSRQWTQQNLSSGMQHLETTVSELNQNQDRDTLIQANTSTFCLPLRFQYQPYEGDQVVEVSAKCEMMSELVTRVQQLQSRLSSVTMEVEESGKLLQSAQISILDSMVEDIFGSTPEFPSSPSSPEGNSDASASKTFQLRRRASLPDTESLYFTKIRHHLCNSSLISKLEAKHDLLKVAIQKAESVDGNHSRMRSKKSVRHKKSNPGSQISQKLFNGDLLSYIQASGQLIPAVVESCIRFINLNGLHHEGLFRVPGSQMVVNQLKDAFEKGDDPLADGGCDMDSVAGVLKLYFRGLEKPLFPEDSYDQLMECGQTDDETKKVTQLKCVISSYPASLINVMRYLFAFLHHVSQYSDENMMQPYNLAVCFGPSLVRGPNNSDAAELQRINALIKSIIIQHESIFPSQNELPGPVYEKCMTLEEDDCEAVAEEGDGESELSQIKEAKDELQGVALFDYTGRSSAELSFKHGDRLTLHSKASSDWWRGEMNGSKGLIPNKYINVQSVDGGQEKKETLKPICGRQQIEEELKAEQSTRLKVASDKAGVGPSHVASGKTSLKVHTGQYTQTGNSPGVLRKTLDPHMRRSAADRGSGEEFSIEVDKEVHNMMHSVFKELLIRQSSPEQNTSTSTEISSPAQTPSNRGLGRKGKSLFRSADNAD